jgi:hypothetical protein
MFSVYLILTAALGLGVHSASNTNEYQKIYIYIFLSNCDSYINIPSSKPIDNINSWARSGDVMRLM